MEHFLLLLSRWRIINEPFFPKGTPLNDLKLRASWGKTGSMDGISNWAAMSLVTSGGNSYNGSSGFKIGADAADLIWEKANQVNVGINAELFNGRLALSVDGYYQKTSGLLYNISTLATTGYTTRTANIGSLENKGLEVMVSGKIFDGPFKWELATNLSYTKNKLLSLDGVLDMKINGGGANTGKVMHALMVGKPVSAFYMLRQDGIYQTDQEVPSKLYAKGVRAGDCKYFDYNNDGDITDDDRMYVGKVTPDIYGGITSTMNWKNFAYPFSANLQPEVKSCQHGKAAGEQKVRNISAWRPAVSKVTKMAHWSIRNNSITYQNMPPTITGGEKELATLFHALLWQARSPAVSETILFLPAIWKMLLISNSKPSHWDIAFLILCCQKYM
mgnify:CR=1 FL=1